MPDERELAAVRLVLVRPVDPRCVRRHRALVPGDRSAELGRDLDERVGDAEVRRQLAHLGSVPTEDESAGPSHRLLDRPRPRRRVAVLVASDPAPEAERRDRRRQPLAEVGDELGRDVEQARLEEPEPVADLVDDARTVRAHLVGLPQGGHLLGDRGKSRLPTRTVECRVVEPVEQPVEPQLRGEHGTPRRLGRVGRQHELEREPAPGGGQLPRAHVRPLQPRERLRERLPRDALLVLVLAPPPQPVVLLGEVRELEVHREGAQHLALPLQRQRRHGVGQPRARGCRAARPRAPRQLADALLVMEETLAALLDEHPAERLAEQADVATERRLRWKRHVCSLRDSPRQRAAEAPTGSGAGRIGFVPISIASPSAAERRMLRATSTTCRPS